MRNRPEEKKTAEVGVPENSGAGRWGLLVLTGEGVTTFPLPPTGQLTIGRSREADVCIDADALSRKHAALDLGPPMRVRDLGSSNGTKLRGQPIPANQWVSVEAGELIELGTVLVLVRRVLPSRPATRQPGAAAAPVVASKAMVEVYQVVDRIAPGVISVLVLGETGVGKEVVAEAVHRRSPRAQGPFVRLNCAAFSESLLESELFGHERGAFTGASEAKAGLLESASGGTVFLDEVGELPPSLQVKLLRVLEERAVRRVGSLTARPLDVRFVAATNRDLEADVASGRFRRDLYFRIAGATLAIPPLRERREEIALLAQAFIEQTSAQLGRASLSLSPEALACLTANPWPGNLRELKNAIERAVLLCPGAVIGPEHLPAAKEPSSPAPAAPGPAGAGGERQRIVEALQQSAGNQSQAAKLLGISRRTLLNRLDEYGIARPQKKPRT